MVKLSKMMMKNIEGIGKTLSEILVCPLTKQPLRYCEKTGSLISDEIGVSFPVVDGIPCLVPKDGKILEDEGSSISGGLASSSDTKEVKE
ncbi:Protein preY mitochondrial [Bienertia sinuspersici]